MTDNRHGSPARACQRRRPRRVAKKIERRHGYAHYGNLAIGTKIDWAVMAWNPLVGCTIDSGGECLSVAWSNGKTTKVQLSREGEGRRVDG